jgi:hypothetical protein
MSNHVININEWTDMVEDFCQKHGLREYFIEQDLLRLINDAYKRGHEDRLTMITQQALLETKEGGGN